MPWMSSPVVLPVLSLIVIGLALGAPLYALLLFDLLLSLLTTKWKIAGLNLDPTDIVFGMLGIVMVLRARRAPRSGSDGIPYFGMWLVLGILMSLSYLNAPSTQQYLTNPVGIVYQLYRYCWKEILYYPLSILLLSQPGRVRHLSFIVILVGVLYSIQAIPGGYAGFRGGPILSSNGLGMALHVPLLGCLTLLFATRSRKTRILTVVSLVLIVRALSFSGSRGAFVAASVGIFVLFGLLATIPATRARLIRLGATAIVLAVCVLVMMPDISQRPTVRRALTLSDGLEVSTFEWRRQERWPHFWQKAVENPWLGTATDLDPTLGRGAITPHNGYLSIAVRYGFPALAIVLSFALLGLRNSLRLFRSPDHPWGRLLGAAGAASLVALLIHNGVDDVFIGAFTSKLFWTLTGLACVAPRHHPASERSAVEPSETGSLPRDPRAIPL